MNYPDPAKGMPSFDVDKQKKIIVTYSSINGNGYGGYGEVVMGTRGTLILEREKERRIYKDADTRAAVCWIRRHRERLRRSRKPPKGRSVAATKKRSSIGHGAFAILRLRISRA